MIDPINRNIRTSGYPLSYDVEHVAIELRSGFSNTNLAIEVRLKICTVSALMSSKCLPYKLHSYLGTYAQVPHLFVVDFIDQSPNVFNVNSYIILMLECNSWLPVPANAWACTCHNDRSSFQGCPFRQI